MQVDRAGAAVDTTTALGVERTCEVDTISRSFDPRVYLFLMLCGIVAGLLVHTEEVMLLVFGIALVWQVLGGRARGIPSLIVGYAVLWALTVLSIGWVASDASSSLALTLSNMGLTGRRAIVPLMFAMLLAKEPTGSFMAALSALRLPKAVGIGIAIGLRFFPTIAQEYRLIRDSQRFRGIGIGILNTLAHLPQVASCILIPLIIRITKIAEELSASVTVRGMGLGNDVVSYRPTQFGLRDAVVFGVTAVSMAVAVVLGNGFEGVLP